MGAKVLSASAIFKITNRLWQRVASSRIKFWGPFGLCCSQTSSHAPVIYGGRFSTNRYTSCFGAVFFTGQTVASFQPCHPLPFSAILQFMKAYQVQEGMSLYYLTFTVIHRLPIFVSDESWSGLHGPLWRALEPVWR